MFKKFFIRRGLKLLKGFLGSRYLKQLFIEGIISRVEAFDTSEGKQLLHDAYDVILPVLEEMVEKEFRG